MIQRFQSFLLSVAFIIVTGHGVNAQTNAIAATALEPIRRFTYKHHALELISAAVHFGVSFEGNQCKIYYSLPQGHDHDYLQYELDGSYQKKIRIDARDSSKPIIITASGNGPHILWIYKTTEALTGPIFINLIEAEDVKALPVPSAPFTEFIGNSITCGADADTAEAKCDTGEYLDHSNAYFAYGPRVARALNINYVMGSVSGIGIYRTWNKESPSMPMVYEKTTLDTSGIELWDFSRFVPAVVSIALGTNDMSRGDGKTPRKPFDSTTFVKGYINFVKLVKSKYPKAQIALLNSPMIQGDDNKLFEHCLQAVKQNIDLNYPGDKAVALYFFPPMQPHGCAGHPSVEDHAILAHELIPFFQKLLKD